MGWVDRVEWVGEVGRVELIKRKIICRFLIIWEKK